MEYRLFLTASKAINTALLERAARQLNGQVIPLSPNAAKISFDAEEAPHLDFGDAAIDANIIPISHQRPKLFLADMDSTMIGQECIDELADYAGVKPQIAEITERAMQGELDFEAALRERVALLEGLPVAALERCYQERITPNKGAKELLAAFGRNGVRRVLVSGGFTFFAERIANELGFDDFHANVFEIRDDKLTGGLLGDIVGRETKQEVLLKEMAALGLDPSQSVAIGDGANDLDMIESAGIGIAYRAKPVLDDAANIRIRHSDLAALIDIFDLLD